jgi:hypothetical protein
MFCLTACCKCHSAMQRGVSTTDVLAGGWRGGGERAGRAEWAGWVFAVVGLTSSVLPPAFVRFISLSRCSQSLKRADTSCTVDAISSS